ncbi:MAG: outer membrane beta-barrel protein [Gammaproteobacteria bacterium]|nr:outer membrane beta-barrel protein [Gammaproteobacteria bacterium]MCW5582272.1 outer membrane beta-barrel protein [Gammaproteobacteria bacterium]
MKKAGIGSIVFFSLLIFTNVADASTPGPYIGVGLGPSRLETSDQYVFNTSRAANTKELGGLGGRAYVGYNFNEYQGIEAGITRYAKSYYFGSMNNASSSLEYSMNAIDLIAKTYLPIGEKRINLYALGGIAAVKNHVQFKNDAGIPFLSDFITSDNGSEAHHNLRPIYGAGVGYDIPKSHFTASVELTRIQGMGNTKANTTAMPSADMLSFSLSYHFD